MSRYEGKSHSGNFRNVAAKLKGNKKWVLLSAIAAVASPLHADPTWTGTGPDGLWTDTANWNTNLVPISGSIATFIDIGSGFTSVDLAGAAHPINTILFNGNSTSYTLGLGTTGDAFNFDPNGAITIAATETANQTINAQLNTNGSMAVTNNGVGSSLTLGGNIVIGSGGTLSVSSSSGNSTILNGNITDTGGSGSVAYNLNTSAGAGNSLIAINGNNTYGGTTAINDTPGTAFDILGVGTDSAFSAGKVIVTGGTSLLGFELQATNSNRTLNNAIDLNGSIALIGGNSFNINGPINVINTAGGTSRVLTNGLSSGATLTYGASTSSASTITLGNPTTNGGDGAGRTLFFGAAANTITNINDVMKDPDAGSGSVGYVGASGSIFNVNNLNTYSGSTFFGGSTGSVVEFINSYTAGGTSGPFGTGTLVFTNGTNTTAALAPVGGGTRTLGNAMTFQSSATFTNAGDNTSLIVSGPVNVSTAGLTILNSLTPANTLFYGASTSAAQTITLPVAGGTTIFTGSGVTVFNDSFALGSSTATTLLNFDGNSGNGTMTINGSLAGLAGGNLQFAGATNTNTGAVGTINFNTTFSGTGSINVSSSGAVIINSQSSFSGGVNFSGGNPLITTFTTSTTGAPGSVTSGPFGVGTITFSGGNNNSTLRPFGGNQVLANAFQLTSGPVFGNVPGDSSSLALTGNITMPSSGRSITNSFATNATLTLGAATSAAIITLSTNSAQTLTFAGTGTTVINDTIVNSGTVSGLVAFGNSNNGSVTVNSINTYTGGTTFNGSNGVTSFDNSTTQGTSGAIISGPFGTGALTFNNTTSAPHIRPIGGNQALANAITVTSNFTVENAPSDTSSLALTGNIALGTSGRTITNNLAPAATLTLGTSGTSAATITLPGGASGQTLVFGGSGVTVINDKFAQNGTSRQNLQFNAGSAGTITVNGALPTGGNLTLSGVTTTNGAGLNILNTAFGGTGSVNIGGNDIQILNAQSTYSGLTTITGSNSGGIIKLPVSSVMSGTSVVSGPFGVGTIQFNSVGIPRIRATGGNQLVGNAIQLLAPLTMDNDPSDTSSLTFSGAVTLGSNSTSIANGFIAGQSAGTLTIGLATNPATITLTATNSVSGETLTYQALNGPIVVNDSMVDGSVMGNVAVNVSTSTAGTGLVTFNGASTYTGSTTIGGGTLSVSADNNLGNGGALTLAATNSATLLSTGTFTSARAVNLSGVGNIIDATGTNVLTLTGSVSGAGDLTKGTNSGTLQLAQSSGYVLSGNVNVNGGLLAFGATSIFTNTPNGPVVNGGGLTGPVNIGGALTINAGTKTALNPSLPGTGQNNSVGSLSIGNSGVLDIGNHTVIVQNAPDETVIGKYLSTGYAGGFWNGTSPSSGAINSIVAFNDNSGATSVGYGNSADFTFGGSTSPYAVGGPKALSGNQVVVAPALAGDLLLSGTVGPNELALMLGSFGTTGNDWAFGNIDYDAAGLVGPNDLSLLLSNFGHSTSGFASAKTSAKSLTSTAKPSLVASASDVAPPPADGIELIVNFQTGDVQMEGNNATAGTSIVLTSAANGLVGGTTFTPAFSALFNTSASNTNGLIDQFNTFTNGSAVNGLVDLGDVYNTTQNSGDIQFQFSEKGINRGGLQTGSVTYVGVPEPTTLSLLAVASAGLLGRRRKRSVK